MANTGNFDAQDELLDLQAVQAKVTADRYQHRDEVSETFIKYSDQGWTHGDLHRRLFVVEHEVLRNCRRDGRAAVEGMMVRCRILEVEYEILLKEHCARRYRGQQDEIAGALKETMSPLFRLPDEILSLIFAFSCDDFEDRPTRRRFQCSSRLSHINKRLRDIALSTRSLWSFIDIQSNTPIERIRLQVERANPRPLDIRLLYTKDDDDTWEDDGIHDALQLVLPYTRWRSCSIVVRTRAVLLPILQQICGPATSRCKDQAPNLLDIKISAGTPLSTPPDIELQETLSALLQCAPNLSRIELSELGIAWKDRHSTRLESLELRFLMISSQPTLPDLLGILGTSLALKELRLSAAGPYMPSHTEDEVFSKQSLPALEIPNLRELHLSAMQVCPLRYLLTLLRLPRLHTLSLTTLRHNGPNGFSRAFSAFSQNLCPSLRRLILMRTSIDSSEFCALLRCVPTTEELVVHGRDNYLLWIIKHDRGRTHPPLLPKLHYLEAKRYPHSRVARFLRHRQRIGLPLLDVAAWDKEEVKVRKRYVDKGYVEDGKEMPVWERFRHEVVVENLCGEEEDLVGSDEEGENMSVESWAESSEDGDDASGEEAENEVGGAIAGQSDVANNGSTEETLPAS